MPVVKIVGESSTFKVSCGDSFKDIANELDLGIVISRGDGTCGTCLFRVTEGLENLSPAEGTEKSFLKGLGAPPNARLGCQSTVLGDCTIDTGKVSTEKSVEPSSQSSTQKAIPIVGVKPLPEIIPLVDAPFNSGRVPIQSNPEASLVSQEWALSQRRHPAPVQNIVKVLECGRLTGALEPRDEALAG